MKLFHRLLIFTLIVVFTNVLIACGAPVVSDEQPSVETEGNEDTASVEVLVARGLALFHIRDNYPDKSPPEDLQWEERRITSEGLVGSNKFEFTSGDWVILISFPVTAPESTIYTIQVLNPVSGFEWQGEVNPTGNVIQVSGPERKIEVLESSDILDPVSTEITLDPTAEWETLINADYNYQIKHPSNTMIVHSGVVSFRAEDIPEGMSAEEYLAQLQETYPGMLCVSMTTDLGYINISAPPNTDFRYSICGRTGVGVGDLVDKTEYVEISGRMYEASGFEFIGNGESLDEHNETMVVILEDGTRIEYGCNPMAAATYEDYLMEGKDVLLLILSTYAELP